MAFKINKITLILFFSAFVLFSCSSTEKKSLENSKEYTSTYVCPMHCEGSGSEEPGVCPVCNMDYVKNPEKEKESFHTTSPKKLSAQLITQ